MCHKSDQLKNLGSKEMKSKNSIIFLKKNNFWLTFSIKLLIISGLPLGVAENYWVRDKLSGGELLELRLLDTQLLDTFGRKSTAQLLNCSTAQLLNCSTAQLLNCSTGFEQLTKKVSFARQCRANDTFSCDI